MSIWQFQTAHFDKCAAVACAQTTPHPYEPVNLATLHFQAALITLCFLYNRWKGGSWGEGKGMRGKGVTWLAFVLQQPTTVYCDWSNQYLLIC